MNSQFTLLGFIFKAFVLCMIVAMWIATREMMELVSEERTMARIGLWIMRILVMLMIAPFLLLGNVDGTPILYASAAAMMALGILAVIMRLFILKDPVQTISNTDQVLRFRQELPVLSVLGHTGMNCRTVPFSPILLYNDCI